MKLRLFILSLAGVFLCSASHRLVGDELENPDPQARENQVKSAIEAAETARQLAAEAGAEWLQTESLLEDAREAAENGYWQQALSLAEQAERQSELAVEQALRESVAWRERVIR